MARSTGCCTRAMRRIRLRGPLAPEPRQGAGRLRRLEPRARLPLRREGGAAGPAGRAGAQAAGPGGRAAAGAHPSAHRARLRAAPPAAHRPDPGDARRRDRRAHDPVGSRRLAIADVAHLGLQICSAIGYLHGHGYLHLDLKPSNVIVAEWAGAGDRPEPRATAGAGAARAGVSPYLAPEQARGDVGHAGHRRLGDRRDAVRGRHRGAALPRCAAEALSAAGAASALRCRKPGARRPDSWSMVDACLSPEPADRPSVAELADELDAVIGP